MLINSFNNSSFLLGHEKASEILTKCSIIIKFFKKSHICQNLLMQEAEHFSIQGGGLKKCIKTRWTSVFESTKSIVRMRQALEEVFIFNKFICNYICILIYLFKIKH